MLDIVRDKLREIYDRLNGKHNTILELFIDQFGEPFVDSDIKTFDELVEFLNSKTLDTFINYEGRNEYGHYSIDRQDYDTNGRGKPFLEYIPDLGILDYITPSIRCFLGLEEDRLKTIMVYFPNVRVTNEYDKFIDIQDLFARVKITSDGRLENWFQLARTTYPYKQFNAGYAHSHMPKVHSGSGAGQWSYPCTGTGPINATMNTLRASYNEQFWGLFTFELAKYVTVESVAGTPYIRLEEVGKGDIDESMSNLNSRGKNILRGPVKHLINAFTQYYAEKHKFKFQFVNGQYQIGESTVSMIVNLSNEFIAFLNDYKCRVANVPTLHELMDSRVLWNYIVANGRIYQILNNGRTISTATSANGRDLFRFKGKMVKLKILFDDYTIENRSLLLTKNCCEVIITNVLSIINYQYGKRQNPSQASQVGSSQGRNQGSIQATARAGEKPCFI